MSGRAFYRVLTPDIGANFAVQYAIQRPQMAQHLPGKIARLIGDFRTIAAVVDLVEHEMEKRIVARHALVKLDALLHLLSRHKNELRRTLPSNQSRVLDPLEQLIARLRNDYSGSDMEAVRDAMSAHALQLDLMRIVGTWNSMGATTFGVLLSDLDEIDAELTRVDTAYPGAGSAQAESAWPAQWRVILDDPARPRYATVYPGLATAGIVSPIPGGHPVQDTVIRAVGLATFLRQIRLMLEVTAPNSTAERMFAEIMLNDFIALWELLFDSNVRNEHGQPDKCVLDHWADDGWKGADCLSKLNASPHPNLGKWRSDVRNKTSAHVDADADIRQADLSQWPMSLADLINEALRAVEHFRKSAALDNRSNILFMPPTAFPPTVIGLAAQEGKKWRDG